MKLSSLFFPRGRTGGAGRLLAAPQSKAASARRNASSAGPLVEAARIAMKPSVLRREAGGGTCY